MPFDAMPGKVAEDVVKLRVALEGVRNAWVQGKWGAPGEEHHCAIGWLLEATEWDEPEATRLALEYVYPALPPSRRNDNDRIWSISRFNDRRSTRHERIVKLFGDAISIAEQAAVR